MLIVCDKDYKVSGKLKIREEQDPSPNDEEVLIKVKSFGINRPDLLQKKGLYPPPASASKILGLECSGFVEKTGIHFPSKQNIPEFHKVSGCFSNSLALSSLGFSIKDLTYLSSSLEGLIEM